MLFGFCLLRIAMPYPGLFGRRNEPSRFMPSSCGSHGHSTICVHEELYPDTRPDEALEGTGALSTMRLSSNVGEGQSPAFHYWLGDFMCCWSNTCLVAWLNPRIRFVV